MAQILEVCGCVQRGHKEDIKSLIYRVTKATMNATIATMLKMELWQADGIMDYSNWHSSNRCSVGRKVGGSKQLLGGENARPIVLTGC